MKKAAFITLVTILLGCSEKPSNAVQALHLEAELVSEKKSIKPGEPFWVGLRIDMEENWHINWVNPGDAGLAPTISWELPEGFSAGEIQWPNPIKIPIDPFMLFGYEGQVLLPVKITPPAIMKKGEPVKIVAHTDWVVCSEACIPGKATLNLELEVEDNTPEIYTTWAGLFEAARNKLPQNSAEWMFNAEINPNRLYIILSPMKDSVPQYERMFFYPEQQGVMNNAANQVLTKEGSSYKLEIERDKMATGTPKELKGVLIVQKSGPNGREKKGIKINIPLKEVEA